MLPAFLSHFIFTAVVLNSFHRDSRLGSSTQTPFLTLIPIYYRTNNTQKCSQFYYTKTKTNGLSACICLKDVFILLLLTLNAKFQHYLSCFCQHFHFLIISVTTHYLLSVSFLGDTYLQLAILIYSFSLKYERPNVTYPFRCSVQQKESKQQQSFVHVCF